MCDCVTYVVLPAPRLPLAAAFTEEGGKTGGSTQLVGVAASASGGHNWNGRHRRERGRVRGSIRSCARTDNGRRRRSCWKGHIKLDELPVLKDFKDFKERKVSSEKVEVEKTLEKDTEDTEDTEEY